jgi:hypothetical protein
VKIDFAFPTQYGVYRDALHLPDDHGLTTAQIQAMQQARVDAWLALITAPPVEEEVLVLSRTDAVKPAPGQQARFEATERPQPPELIEVDGIRYRRVVDG